MAYEFFDIAQDDRQSDTLSSIWVERHSMRRKRPNRIPWIRIGRFD